MEKPKDLIFILEEQLKFIKMTVTEREYLENTINKLKIAINYTRCCAELKDKKPISFEKYKDTWFTKENDIIYFDKLTTEFVDINEIMKKYQEYYLRF